MSPRGYANEGPKKSQEVKETAKPCWPHLDDLGYPWIGNLYVEKLKRCSKALLNTGSLRVLFDEELGDFG